MSEPPPHSGLVADLVGRVLGFIDRPWKAVTVVVLLLLLGLGAAVWTERALLVAWLQTPAKASLRLAELQPATIDLLLHTSASVISIWAVDLNENTQTYLTSKLRSGQPWDFAFRRLPVVTESLTVDEILKLIRGRPFCDNPATRGSLLMQHFAEAGMVRVCVIPIPPGPATTLGAIYVAWQVVPPPATEEAALDAAMATAAAIVRR